MAISDIVVLGHGGRDGVVVSNDFVFAESVVVVVSVANANADFLLMGSCCCC